MKSRKLMTKFKNLSKARKKEEEESECTLVNCNSEVANDTWGSQNQDDRTSGNRTQAQRCRDNPPVYREDKSYHEPTCRGRESTCFCSLENQMMVCSSCIGYYHHLNFHGVSSSSVLWLKKIVLVVGAVKEQERKWRRLRCQEQNPSFAFRC